MSIFISIKSKLLMIVMCALIILGIASLLTTYRLSNNVFGYEQVIQSKLIAEKYALSANLEFKRQVQEWKNTLIRGANEEKREKYWNHFLEQHNSTQTAIQKLIPLIQSEPELAAVANQFLIDHNSMLKVYTEGKNLYIANNFDISIGDNSVSGIDRAPSKALDQLAEALDILATEQTNKVSVATASNVKINYILTLAIVLIIAFIVYFILEKLIVTPLSSVRDTIASVANGDLSTTNNYYSNDEIGHIADSTRQLQTFLLENVKTLKITSKSLINEANMLETMSKHLNEQTTHQRGATEQVSSAIKGFHLSSESIAQSATQTLDTTKHASQLTNDSSAVSREVRNQISQLVLDLDKSSTVINELSKNAANVGNVLEVIRGVAEQTNLLALNAAIEAARAGEQGRGFAVVADEVRTLALRTQQSTAEIENILNNISTGAKESVIMMENSNLASNSLQDKNADSERLLRDITDKVNTINIQSSEIANAITEQTDVIGEASDLIQNIYTMSEETKHQVSKTQSISSQLKELSSKFENQISRFKLPQRS